MKTTPEVREYFSKMGAKGGAKSRRTLSKSEARAMVAAREAKRAKKGKAKRRKRKPALDPENERWRKAAKAAHASGGFPPAGLR